MQRGFCVPAKKSHQENEMEKKVQNIFILNLFFILGFHIMLVKITDCQREQLEL